MIYSQISVEIGVCIFWQPSLPSFVTKSRLQLFNRGKKKTDFVISMLSSVSCMQPACLVFYQDAFYHRCKFINLWLLITRLPAKTPAICCNNSSIINHHFADGHGTDADFIMSNAFQGLLFAACAPEARLVFLLEHAAELCFSICSTVLRNSSIICVQNVRFTSLLFDINWGALGFMRRAGKGVPARREPGTY